MRDPAALKDAADLAGGCGQALPRGCRLEPRLGLGAARKLPRALLRARQGSQLVASTTERGTQSGDAVNMKRRAGMGDTEGAAALAGPLPNRALQPSHFRVTALAQGRKRRAARRSAERDRYAP